MSNIRRLLRTLPLFAIVSLSGCASLIQNNPQEVGNAGHGLSIPARQYKGYEAPIPKWNSAYRGVPEYPAMNKRVTTALDIVDGVREGLANLDLRVGSLGGGGRTDYVHLTPLAISFCTAGVPQSHDKNWWRNTFSMQPGGLALAVAEEQVRRKCETSYRRSHE